MAYYWIHVQGGSGVVYAVTNVSALWLLLA